KPPFNNQQVRQATELSIDRNALTSAMVGKAGQGPAWEYVPPGFWAYTKDLKDWKYDPAKAKQMLAAAGYPNGITSRVCVFSNDTVKAATIEKQQMAPAGITLVLDQEPVNACFTLVQQGKDQMIQVGWFFLASPYQGYATMFGARAGVPQYPGVDAVLQKATQVYTQQQQKPVYDQMNRMLYDLAPSIPTYWLVNPVAYSKRIQGITFDINGQEHLDFAHFQ
ncbi:MAG: hypothetical protein J2P45_04505, partial [Candidatus Dormibacteraeota bacterium]|nr:hypothetical protein [Candidatus Dormibacteraeota bacterium]